LLKKKPRAVKDHLVALAKRELPQKMGEIYAGVVVEYLTCLDKHDGDEMDEDDEQEAEDAVSVGLRHHEQVGSMICTARGYAC
jgi:hypothetical protein